MKTNSKTQTAGVKVAAGIKAGGMNMNHSRRMRGLKVRTGLKAGEGIVYGNHSRRLA